MDEIEVAEDFAAVHKCLGTGKSIESTRIHPLKFRAEYHEKCQEAEELGQELDEVKNLRLKAQEEYRNAQVHLKEVVVKAHEKAMKDLEKNIDRKRRMIDWELLETARLEKKARKLESLALELKERGEHA
ncbi:MAG: hypothetical protein M1822_003198 [Bathelium mastoideum]|nr:MAG: hypothetical protein M1822_003198 [Bathelium mastoideum]